MKRPLKADWIRLTDLAIRSRTERNETFQAGGGEMGEKSEFVLRDAACASVGDGLLLMAERPGGFLEAACRALGLPDDWQGYYTLRLELTNGDQECAVTLEVLGTRGRIVVRRQLAPGEMAEMTADLRDLSLTEDYRPPNGVAGIRLSVSGAALGGRAGCSSANCGSNRPPTGGRFLALVRLGRRLSRHNAMRRPA